jgi:hypothetical protein
MVMMYSSPGKDPNDILEAPCMIVPTEFPKNLLLGLRSPSMTTRFCGLQ